METKVGVKEFRAHLPAYRPKIIYAFYIETDVIVKQNSTIQMAAALILVAMVLSACGGGEAGADATGDTSPPSQPSALLLGQRSSSTLSLSWSPSSDDVAVDHYDVLLNGVTIAASNGTAYTVTGLLASTGYNLSVEAVDAAGNRSTRSATLSATTTALLGSNAQVSYDFTAGDSLLAKDGWSFSTTDWDLSPIYRT